MASLKIVSDRLDDNSIALRVVLPARRNGEVNFGALEAINRALYVIRPDAFDPEEKPAPVLAHNDGHTSDGGGIVLDVPMTPEKAAAAKRYLEGACADGVCSGE